MVKMQVDLDLTVEESKRDIEIYFHVLSDLTDLMLKIPTGTHITLKEEDIVEKATQNFKYTPKEFIITMQTIFNKHIKDNGLEDAVGTELCIYNKSKDICRFTFEYNDNVLDTKEMKIYHIIDSDLDDILELEKLVEPNDLNFLFFEAICNQLEAEHIARFGLDK